MVSLNWTFAQTSELPLVLVESHATIVRNLEWQDLGATFLAYRFADAGEHCVSRAHR
jgi:hypothetical protein